MPGRGQHRLEGKYTTLGTYQPTEGDRGVSVVCADIEPRLTRANVVLEPAQQGALGSPKDSGRIVVPRRDDAEPTQGTPEDAMRPHSLRQQLADARLQAPVAHRLRGCREVFPQPPAPKIGRASCRER